MTPVSFPDQVDSLEKGAGVPVQVVTLKVHVSPAKSSKALDGNLKTSNGDLKTSDGILKTCDGGF